MISAPAQRGHAHDIGNHARDMRERDRGDRAVGRFQLHASFIDHRGVDDVAMGEHCALGTPGRAGCVEDHRGVFFGDIGGLAKARCRSSRENCETLWSSSTAIRCSRSGTSRAVRQAVDQRGLVDQELGAAVGQHIGNFRLLLAGAEQNRDCAEMRRAKHRKHELDAIAEQQRDPVAALQAQLAQTRRDRADCCSTSRQLIRVLAADQRLAIRISAAACGDHLPDAFRPFAKRRHDAIAEARLELHGRNRILRPVH